MEVKKEGETVYKNSTEESHLVMNDKVQALAGSIYEEFEKMISSIDVVVLHLRRFPHHKPIDLVPKKTLELSCSSFSRIRRDSSIASFLTDSFNSLKN